MRLRFGGSGRGGRATWGGGHGGDGRGVGVAGGGWGI